MKILKSSEINQELLNSFKAKEWSSVDDSHFDDKELVDFDEVEDTRVAVDDDQNILGYIKTKTEMGTCEIESLIIGKDFRNKGLAMQLVNIVEEGCKKMNIHKIWLETGIDWDARKLYEKMGYKDVAVLKNHFGHKDFVLMEKLLM